MTPQYLAVCEDVNTGEVLEVLHKIEMGTTRSLMHKYQFVLEGERREVRVVFMKKSHSNRPFETISPEQFT